MHYSEKTHFFRDDQDNRFVVHTRLLPDGSYEAETDDEAKPIYGHGSTRLEAIADLQLHLDLERDQ